MKTAALTLVLALAAIATGCTTAENSSRNLGDPSVHGKTLAEQVCSDCHGVTGNSVNPTFPRLAGQQEWYLIAQLKQFRGHNQGTGRLLCRTQARHRQAGKYQTGERRQGDFR
jgi:cytochrome c553